MLRLYDTRTRQARPIGRGGLLRAYSCGPGGPGRAHLGDLRSGLLADLIRRSAEHRHHLTVVACEGIADLAGAGPDADADQAAYQADRAALNLRPAEHSPRASQEIALITGMISRLIEAGSAQVAAGGSVYFDARSAAGYGELSGDRPPGARPGDWALWEAAPPGREPAWAAPWGSGVPGWPAACSALARHYLGEVIDLHTADVGLCVPHGEQERAQSDALAGHEVVRHWAYSGRVRFGGEAPAGAGGAGDGPSDLAERGLDPLALRLAFLGWPYRQPLDLTWDALTAADRALRRWRALVAQWACSPSKPMCAQVTSQIAAAFDDDLDTPAVLGALRALARDPQIPPGAKFETFAYTDQLLGLDLARDVGRAAAG
ncbi:MAG TPA: cysteine--tRNA ligase [Streptosporangiaceae bacterium]|nr:cysteine--tRNA ligase [Streptosporangiaceae bacterium]